MHHQDLCGGHVLLSHELGERAAARVHEVLRFGENDLASADEGTGNHAAGLALPVARAGALGQHVDGGKANVVTRALVLWAGVAQAAHEPDLLGTRGHDAPLVMVACGYGKGNASGVATLRSAC